MSDPKKVFQIAFVALMVSAVYAGDLGGHEILSGHGGDIGGHGGGEGYEEVGTYSDHIRSQCNATKPIS